VPWSQRPRFEDVVITSEVPFPTRDRKCAPWDASEGSAFGDLLPRIVSASQLGQQLRANVGTTSARIEHPKFPVMNTCTKKGGGYPLAFSAFGTTTVAWIRLPRRAGGRVPHGAVSGVAKSAAI
jgi:hypothetical protein